MRILASPRQTGKTTFLIDEFLKDPEHSAIVYAPKAMARAYLERRLQDCGYRVRPWQIVSYEACTYALRGRDIRVLMDDYDLIAPPVPSFSLVTMSGLPISSPKIDLFG